MSLNAALSNALTGLNASGFSPGAVTPQFFAEHELQAVPQTGAFSV